MRRWSSMLIAFGCLTFGGTLASAAPVTYSGTGTVSQVAGKLPPTGVVPVGSKLSFSFTFDPSKASLYEASDGYAVYDLTLSSAIVALGGFTFPLSSDPAFTPVVELYRGFSFFPGSSMSEESLGFTFYLAGKPTVGSATEPFAGSPGNTQQIAIGGVFRSLNDGLPLTISHLFGAGAVYQNFEYETRDPATRLTGLLRGNFSGNFSNVVPEPAAWGLMIAGFALAGAALRRNADPQRGRRASAI